MRRNHCQIVCVTACSNCDVLDCEDRLCDRREDITASAGPFDVQREKIQGAEELRHCGMADPLICRHCHEEHCRVRKAERVF